MAKLSDPTLPKQSDDYIIQYDWIRSRIENEIGYLRSVATLAAAEKVFDLRAELEWLEFFDAETIPTEQSDNTYIDRLHRTCEFYESVRYAELLENMQLNMPKSAQEMKWILFQECN